MAEKVTENNLDLSVELSFSEDNNKQQLQQLPTRQLQAKISRFF